jgi:hypothetical protein
MNTHADKTQENKNQSVTNKVVRGLSGGESSFQFADNRPEAMVQRKLQKMTNNSLQVSQLIAFQEMANSSPHDKETAQMQFFIKNKTAQPLKPIQKKENNTGLPDNLLTGLKPYQAHIRPDHIEHVHQLFQTSNQNNKPIQPKFKIGKDEFEFDGDVLKNKPLMNFLGKWGPDYVQAANELAIEEKDYGTLTLDKLLTYISDKGESLKKTRTAAIEERNNELSQISGGKNVTEMLDSGHSEQQHLAANEPDAQKKAKTRWVIEGNDSFSLGFWLSLHALQNYAAECVKGYDKDFAATVDLKLGSEIAVAVGIDGKMYECDAAIIVVKDSAITTFYPVVKAHIVVKATENQLKSIRGEEKKPAITKGNSKVEGKKKGKK